LCLFILCARIVPKRRMPALPRKNYLLLFCTDHGRRYKKTPASESGPMKIQHFIEEKKDVLCLLIVCARIVPIKPFWQAMANYVFDGLAVRA
jgi:hypothetical protein